ncbi:hypothetical protein FB384_004935 [Prauserella sediminis]|uniref:Uncharacterized protein n=1 Tax=Prauserella sediminis TaxID=577680 RepID=A0A839Y119_9PSEU|nr:hypothetical protein [Prauserella sediminis]MBB3665976.1 hypothetical protein [Prauserella sediminis]
MSPDQYFDDAVRRSVTSVRENDRHPLGVWSTGEKLLVALVLMDREYLADEGYSYDEAMTRVAGGIGVDRGQLPEWLDRVRQEVERQTP